MYDELEAFEVNVFKPAGGLKGATAAGVFVVGVDEAELRGSGGFIYLISNWNVLNSAESASELENELAAGLSESTYQTILSLQSNLRSMLDAYQKKCHCEK